MPTGPDPGPNIFKRVYYKLIPQKSTLSPSEYYKKKLCDWASLMAATRPHIAIAYPE